MERIPAVLMCSRPQETAIATEWQTSIPCGVERLGRLLPGQPLVPPGQKPGEGIRKRALGVVGKRPRHAFHLDPTPGTVRPPGWVNKKHRDSPKRDERKPTRGETIVAGTPFEAFATLRTTVGSWLDKDSSGVFLRGSPLGLCVDEGLEFLNKIEDSNDLHPLYLSF